MRFLLTIFALVFSCVGPLPAQTPSAEPSGAAERPLWMRYPALSPDGKTVAFTYRGHLFTVPSAGGPARPLTAGTARDFQPVWSPDSRTVAYASDLYGNFDVFVIPAAGGSPVRLTTHSADEVPTGFTPDGRNVLFSAHRQDSRLNAQFPSSRVMPELYKVSVEPGHAPEQILTTPALAAQYDRAGKRIVYEDLKGYENLWRKHEQTSVTHDLWIYDVEAGTHRQLTTFVGEDRNPVWSPDEKSVFYLSEQGGSFNVWKLAVEGNGQPEQVTHFTKNPVRFLSTDNAGNLCFGYDGELYLLPVGTTEPHRIAVQMAYGDASRLTEFITMADGATDIALNPDGKEIAFVARGEVFVASTEYGITKRITNTPGQERGVSFSPDGRRLVFAGETDKSWNLYEAALARPKEDEPYFFNSTLVDVKPILENGQENFQPSYSPDGKEVAYLENRTALRVLNLESKQTRLVLAGDKNYSYEDGDQWYHWSPDGKWFVVQFMDPHRWSNEAGLVDAEGRQQLINLTRSGYEDVHPSWSPDGIAMIWFSDRAALHGTGGGALSQGDVYAMFFTRKAFDRFNLSKAELELVKKAEDDAKKDKEKEKDKDKKPEDKEKKPEEKDKPSDDKDKKPDENKDKDAKKKDDDKKKEPVEIDFDHFEDRVARLTINSSDIHEAALTPDGEQLIYLIKTDDGYELWQNKLREKETKRLASLGKGDGDSTALFIDKDGKTAFVLAGGRIGKIGLSDAKNEAVHYSAEMNLNRDAERAYIFEHAWRQTREKFYVTDLHGVNWDEYKAVYAKFLPFINNNYDFAEMLSELLGELNASHTGCNYRPRHPGGDDTAALGIFADLAHRGPGLKVDEIIEKGPVNVAKSKITAGMIIEKIDGVVLTPGIDWCPLLNRKAGRPVLLTVFDPVKNGRFDETVKPITIREQEELLYQRWVKSRRELTEKLSGGRIGYVHVRGMDDGSYRETFSEVLGRNSDKEAIIVDTRFNGGGNLHDELATLLSGKEYLQFVPRGRLVGEEPTNKWDRRSVVLIGESNYSDAHLFPWTYRALGIGKLIGMPVPGTGTAVWWERQQDPSPVFGIPEVGFRDRTGGFMERADIKPDIQVANDYESVARGQDKQLEKAVEFLLHP